MTPGNVGAGDAEAAHAALTATLGAYAAHLGPVARVLFVVVPAMEALLSIRVACADLPAAVRVGDGATLAQLKALTLAELAALHVAATVHPWERAHLSKTGDAGEAPAPLVTPPVRRAVCRRLRLTTGRRPIPNANPLGGAQ
jgi:hypothetical protein